MKIESILTLVGLVLLIFQINQHAISSIKEKKMQAYSRFVEAAQSALPPIGQTASPDAIKSLSSALMEMTMFAAPDVLIEIVGLQDKNGKIEMNDKKLIPLRLKMRKDLHFKFWEYVPIYNWTKYSKMEKQINREHMMQINLWGS